MAILPDEEVLCIIFDGPPIEQVVESQLGADSNHHTFYYRMNDEQPGTVRILHTLYYQNVTSLESGGIVMALALVVTTNHNSVLLSYGSGGHGSFVVPREMVDSRRL